MNPPRASGRQCEWCDDYGGEDHGSGDEDEPALKKAKFDNGTSCCGASQHGNVQCFIHQISKHHFVLDDAMKRLWAARMNNGRSDITDPPIETPLWCKQEKKLAPIHEGNNPPPTLSALPTGMQSFSPPTPYPTRPPLYPQSADHHSSPPPADGTSISDFYQKYDLGEEVDEGLTALRFRLGDDHWAATPEALTSANFAAHHWKWFCKAYHKYKHANK